MASNGRPPSIQWQERIDPDEAQRFERHARRFAQMQQIRNAALGPGRALHRHQLLALKAQFEVLDNLDGHAAQGLFARPGKYEAWVRLQQGDIDSALVYAFGRSSQGDLADVMVAQLDPYVVAPLAPDWVSLAALQARALLDAERCTERDMAEVAARCRGERADALLRAPYVVEPLRGHDCPTCFDGAAAVVLVAGELARKVCARPAWIRGIDHRIEAHSLGARDLTRSPSAALAAKNAGAVGRTFDVAEVHAPFSHQEIILRHALGLGADVAVNPSGGALANHPFIVCGLNRIGEAATRVVDGRAKSALAHATSGPCLQQNLVCVLEASS